MSYNRKTWINRNVEHPYRRTLTDTTSGTSQTVDVTRAEGTITAEGDTFDANTMNNMEGRIADQFSVVDQRTGALTDLDTTDKSSLVAAINEVAQGGGGGGSSTLAGLTDTSISSPTNGQVLKYNSTSSKWENANESGGSGTAKQIIITCDLTEETLGSIVDQDGNTIAIASLYNYAKAGANIILIDSSSVSLTSLNEKEQYFLSDIDGYTDVEDDSEHIKYFFTSFAFSGTVYTSAIDYNITDEVLEVVHKTITSSAPLASPVFTGSPTAPTPTTGDDSTKIATTAFIQDAIDKATQFQVNEELALTGGIYAGSITGASKNIYFFIPLPKGTANVSNVAVSGNWYIRGVSGHILSNATLASAGTVTPSLVAGGVQILLEMSTAHSTLTNTPLTALAWTNAKLKFT